MAYPSMFLYIIVEGFLKFSFSLKTSTYPCGYKTAHNKTHRFPFIFFPFPLPNPYYSRFNWLQTRTKQQISDPAWPVVPLSPSRSIGSLQSFLDVNQTFPPHLVYSTRLFPNLPLPSTTIASSFTSNISLLRSYETIVWKYVGLIFSARAATSSRRSFFGKEIYMVYISLHLLCHGVLMGRASPVWFWTSPSWVGAGSKIMARLILGRAWIKW